MRKYGKRVYGNKKFLINFQNCSHKCQMSSQSFTTPSIFLKLCEDIFSRSENDIILILLFLIHHEFQ